MKRILGILGWLGVVLVVGAVILRFTRPEQPQLSQGLALAGLLDAQADALPPVHSAGSRIEIADLKERIRKLEAIAAGVDL